MTVQLKPIGTVTSPRVEIKDDDWGQVLSTITLDATFGADALAGIDAFSHLEVIYYFHQVTPASIESGARHPRNNYDWPLVGIFAQRGKNRPNQLGLSVCELVGVEGATLTVRGLDAIDGTPVLDIKPVMREFLPRGEVRQPEWAGELMAKYY